MSRMLVALIVAALPLLAVAQAPQEPPQPGPLAWKKTVLDTKFRSEGVTAMDVNNDGQKDVVVGEFWYEAPRWTRHEMQPPGNYPNPQGQYSRVFCCWPEDFNNDGYLDVLVIDFPGNPCYWLENPRGRAIHWKKHPVCHSACNETPQYVDLFGNGKQVLIIGVQPKGKNVDNEGRMAYLQPLRTGVSVGVMGGGSPGMVHLDIIAAPGTEIMIQGQSTTMTDRRMSFVSPALEPGKVYRYTVNNRRGEPSTMATTSFDVEAGNGYTVDFTKTGIDHERPWALHAISEESVPPTMENGKAVPRTGKMVPGTQRFSHGLGVGDMNSDGRRDVICTGGWWEQPDHSNGQTPWKFHPCNLGEACADMFAVDLDNDKQIDVISSSAHRFGIWWHKRRGPDAFEKRDLFPQLLSETHAAHYLDLDGDGEKDLVTGKRWWSHGRAEPGADWPAMLYWFKGKRDNKGMLSFTPMIIDTDSGVGTQFAVDDVNGDGLLDVVISNKKGVSLHVQQRTKR